MYLPILKFFNWNIFLKIDYTKPQENGLLKANILYI